MMIILPQTINVNTTGTNKSWYQNKGYDVSSKVIEVNVLDLPKGSHSKIKIHCDYCLEEGIVTEINKVYKNYINQNEKMLIHKDACRSCFYKKTKESNIIKYGKEHVLQIESVIEKRLDTNLEKYGSKSALGNPEILEKSKATSNERYGKDYYMQTDEYMDRAIKTNMNNYGTEYTFQAEEVKDKIKDTNLQRYGVEYVSQSPMIREKAQATMIERYGVINISQIPELHKKSLEKAKVTMYENQTAPSSMQQKYIHSLIGGKLNYPFGSISLDIAYPDENVYFEYDGGGHNLSVIFGTYSQEDFDKRERNRYYFLRKQKWKSIRLISVNNEVPNHDKLKDIMKIGRRILKKRSWIEFNMDDGTVKTSKGILNYNFGYIITRNQLIKLLDEE